jgi:deazaflavin-dependent oxidoreductase (nitroreductase family)
MGQLTHRPNAVQRFLHFIPKSRPGAWFFARTLRHLDRPIQRLSGGRQSLTHLMSGLPVVTVTTIGAKSGQPRTLPLLAVPDGENIILIASNFGQERHPAWYYNLRAHPQVQLTYEGKTATYLARETDDAERERCWQRAVDLYSGYAVYKERARQRKIGVFLLTPQTHGT